LIRNSNYKFILRRIDRTGLSQLDPRREGIARGLAAFFQQGRDAFTAAEEGFEECVEAIGVVGDPDGREAAEGLVEDCGREVADAVDPGLEIVQRFHVAVDAAAGVEAGEGGIGEVPVGAVEGEAVVDHEGDKAELARRDAGAGEPVFELGAEEDGLAAVGVGDPAVEGEDGEELVGVGELVEEGVGDEVIDGEALGVAGMAGTEVPAGLDGGATGAGLEVNFGVGGEEGGRQDDELGGRRGDLQVGENGGGQELVDEDAAVLGVILKLDDVEVAVVGFEQMGLGAAAHFADKAAGVYRHKRGRGPGQHAGSAVVKREFREESITEWQTK